MYLSVCMYQYSAPVGHKSGKHLLDPKALRQIKLSKTSQVNPTMAAEQRKLLGKSSGAQTFPQAPTEKENFDLIFKP